MEEHEKLLKIKNLKKKYQINKEESLQVLKGLSFSIAHGEMAAVMGASGCGKTTLINLICGVDKADEGEYYDRPYRDYRNEEIPKWQSSEEII